MFFKCVLRVYIVYYVCIRRVLVVIVYWACIGLYYACFTGNRVLGVFWACIGRVLGVY